MSPDWTACEDELPPAEVDVLLVGRCPEDSVARFDVGYFVRRTAARSVVWDWKWSNHAPTHWQALPVPPV